MVKGAGAEKGFLGVLGIRVCSNAQPRVRAPEARPDSALWARNPALHAWVSLEAPCTQLASERGRWRRRSKRVPSRSPPPPPTFFPPGEMRAHCPGRRAPGIPESPPASRRDPPRPPWLCTSQVRSFSPPRVPRDTPVPTPESWRPARDARRPAGRAACQNSAFLSRTPRVASQAPGKPCRPGLGGHAGKKPPTPAPPPFPSPPHPRRQGRLRRLNSCSVSLPF